MLVRQLMGPYAGQLVEMPYPVAQNCIACGTAADPDDHAAAASVKGLKIMDPAPAVEIPDGWESLNHIERRALATSITGQTYKKAGAADAAIRAHLQG